MIDFHDIRVVAGLVTCVGALFGGIALGRGCRTDPPTVVTSIAPDGGIAQQRIEARVDAAVAQREEVVRTIEHRVIVERRVHDEQLAAQERAVRDGGRPAMARWFTDFSRTIGTDAGDDGGSNDGGTP